MKNKRKKQIENINNSNDKLLLSNVSNSVKKINKKYCNADAKDRCDSVDCNKCRHYY